MANQNEPPLKKDKTIEEILNRDNAMMRSPLLWFVLLAVPVLVGFYAAFSQSSEPSAQPQPAISYTPEQSGEAQDAPPGHRNELLNPDMGRRGGTPEICGDYAEWIGKPAGEELQAGLKSKNKAFRILPPGSMMTMDYSPERVNFDVDADGKITRVWCG